MKQKNTFLHFAVLLILFAGLMSCQSSSKHKAELKFTNYHHSEKIHLFNNDNYPSFNLDVQITLPKDSIAYSALYQAMSSSFFDTLYKPTLSVQKNLDLSTTLYTNNYRSIEEELDLDSTDIGASYNWEMIKNNKVVYHGQRYISFLNEAFAFTGGAHGNTIRSYFTFDLQNNKLLSSSDVFKINSCDTIIKLQKISLAKTGMQMDQLYSDGYKCDDNFYLVKEGIIFHYNQYEIASYAAGPIGIFISFQEIKPFLKIDIPILEQKE